MAHIIETPNPLQPFKDMKKHTHPGGVSIWQWLRTTYPGFQEFDKPTLCLVNGSPKLRKDWCYVLKKEDVVTFVAIVGDPFSIVALIISVVLVAVTIALTLSMKMPKTPGELPGSDPVFSLKGRQNTIRLGEPIEVCYGRNRIYPSMASRPYYNYINNDQFQHSLYCIGQGHYDIEAVQIGDTSIDNYQEAEYEVIPPGGRVTLFQTNVYTSAEAGEQTLFAPNEEEYVAPGYVGPFSVSPAGTRVTHIDIDLSYPKGLFFLNSNGTLQEEFITTVAEYRAIDDAGSPLTAWFTLFTRTDTEATTTSQRITVQTDVVEARYEVRLRRTTDKNLGINAGNDVAWDGMRAHLTGDNPDYGDVTLLAVKIQASDNLNANTRLLTNVIATRKLPLRDPSTGSWSEPVETRSIIWAFVDVFRSLYGGRLADTFFDWDTLYILEGEYEYRNEHFDWIFRDAITVWEAATTIAQVGRAVPMLVGSLVSLRREELLVVPTMLFGPDNIVRRSLEWNILLWDAEEYDSMLVEYTEPTTGYQQETMLVTLPGDTSDHPESVRLVGVQERNHAYHQALFLLAKRRYVRETVSFETGMEGLIASYGDLVAISHDVPDWSQSGYVVASEEQTDGLYLLYLSQVLEFESGQNYQMLLRGRRGECMGPYTVIEIDDPQRVLLDTGSDTITDFLVGGMTEPMIFAFGPASQVTKLVRVVSMEPQGGERVKIMATADVPVIYTFDHEDAPELPQLPVIPEIPDIPEIPNRLVLTPERIGDTVMIRASWPAVAGAAYYIFVSTIDPSFSFTGDVRHIIQTSASYHMVNPGIRYFRVAAVSIRGGRGPWISASITIGLVTQLYETPPGWVSLDNTINWYGNNLVDKYRVRVYDNTNPGTPVLKNTTEVVLGAGSSGSKWTYFTYTYAQAVTDGALVRNRLYEVDSMYLDPETNTLVADNLPEELAITNSMPGPPTSPSAANPAVNGGGTAFEFDFAWTNPALADLIRVRIYASTTAGFTPGAGNQIFDSAAGSPGYAGVDDTATAEVPFVSGTFPDYYWKVAVFDVWGLELSGNVSAEQTITLPWLLAGGDWSDVGRWIDASVWED